MSRVYYNEHDPKKAAWLRELMAAGVIADGIVDERSIEDVLPSELMDFTRCHFFAGVGIWEYALQQAGWPEGRRAWTGSCPCQPFSAAGQRKGTADERHLWPAFHWLISQCRPDVVFGEQVASKDGLAWLDIVCDDLEAAGYAIGPLDLCAAGVGAPHIRQRLYFVAFSPSQRRRIATRGLHAEPGECRATGQLAYAEDGDGWSGERGEKAGVGALGERGRGSASSGTLGILGDADEAGSQGRRLSGTDRVGDSADQCVAGQAGPTNGYWRGAEWIYCRDGKHRATQPGISPLVDGDAERLVRGGDPSAPIDANNTAEARALRLTGYGDAIVAPLAIEFLRAAMEAIDAH